MATDDSDSNDTADATTADATIDNSTDMVSNGYAYGQ